MYWFKKLDALNTTVVRDVKMLSLRCVLRITFFLVHTTRNK